jgi:hypothetical protein
MSRTDSWLLITDDWVGGWTETRYNGAQPGERAWKEGPCTYLKDTLMHRDCDLP